MYDVISKIPSDLCLSLAWLLKNYSFVTFRQPQTCTSLSFNCFYRLVSTYLCEQCDVNVACRIKYHTYLLWSANPDSLEAFGFRIVIGFCKSYDCLLMITFEVHDISPWKILSLVPSVSLSVFWRKKLIIIIHYKFWIWMCHHILSQQIMDLSLLNLRLSNYGFDLNCHMKRFFMIE